MDRGEPPAQLLGNLLPEAPRTERMTMATAAAAKIPTAPDLKISVRQQFGIDSDLEVPGFSEKNEHVPDLDTDYLFDRDTTLAILAGFAHNRRVMIQGYHGTGKSTHIEQVAARLNWPCIRVNLDSHVSRIDLVGKDAIVLKDGKQITEFREGILPYCLQIEHRAGVRRVRRRPPGRDVRHPAGAGSVRQADTARPVEGDPRRTRISGCSRPPTPSALAIPPASITAPSRSTRARWTAGRS